MVVSYLPSQLSLPADDVTSEVTTDLVREARSRIDEVTPRPVLPAPLEYLPEPLPHTCDLAGGTMHAPQAHGYDEMAETKRSPP